jgi:hypothetical protein
MNTRVGLYPFVAAALVITALSAQTPAPVAQRLALAEVLPPAEGDNEKDPGYKTYKEGYALVLADRYPEAIKKLAEVKAKYPKSEYVDDAEYWSAYAQKRLDSKKGREAYQLFLERYPESSYYDDAVADMNDDVTVVVSGDAKNFRIKRAPHAYMYSYGSSLAASARAMRDAEREMRRVQMRLGRLSGTTPGLPGGASHDNTKLDQETRLRLTALQALSESGNDKEAFATLKEVALDKSQPDIMRITAIESLEGFRKFDVLPVLVDIARTDPNDDIQVSAIYTIADAGGDKNKTVDALVTLFQSYPKEKEKQQQTALYAIADIGNDKAVDFLVKVATTNENYELRNDAVYYLGNIGSEKSRAALLQILRMK